MTRRDPNRIKRPCNSFFLYRKDKNKELMERDTQRGIQPQGIYSKEISEKWKVEKPEVKAKYTLDAEHDMAVYHARKEEEQRAAREVEGAQPAGQTAAGDEGTGLHQGRTSPPGLPGLIPSSGFSAHASSPGPNTPPSASGQLSHPPFQPQAPEKDDSHGLTQDEYNVRPLLYHTNRLSKQNPSWRR